MLFMPMLLFGRSPFSASPDLTVSNENQQDWSETDYALFLPTVSRWTSIDLTVSGVEVTQTIQTMTNSVDLVAGRPTVLRVFGKTNTTLPIWNVDITVEAKRNGQPLSGSPIVLGSQTIQPVPTRTDISSTANLRLPGSWLSGRTQLTITINPSEAIAEVDASNNTLVHNANYIDVPALDVKIIPIEYLDMYYTLFPAVENFDFIDNMLMKMYPVNDVVISRRTTAVPL